MEQKANLLKETILNKEESTALTLFRKAIDLDKKNADGFGGASLM